MSGAIGPERPSEGEPQSEIDLRGTLTEDEARCRDRLAARVLSASVDALELFSFYIGDRLGLYRVLADHGPLDAAELAVRAEVSDVYALEWLDQQAVAGVIDVVEEDGDWRGPQRPGAEARSRRFRLRPGHAEVLVDGSSLSHLVPVAMGVAGVARALPQILDAFASGGGVPDHRYGPDLRWCSGRLNRPRFFRQLGTSWFPAIPDVDTRLRSRPAASVADIGCGTGWSSIAIALAYPTVTVHGFDPDGPSVAEAQLHATAYGVADRVMFRCGDTDTLTAAPSGAYDLACAFEVLDRTPDPVGLLKAMRGLVGTRGTVLIASPHVAESFTAPGDESERFHHAWSALYRLPRRLAGPASAAESGGPASAAESGGPAGAAESGGPAGTSGPGLLRPGMLRGYALAAGFEDVRPIAIGGESPCLYLLDHHKERAAAPAAAATTRSSP